MSRPQRIEYPGAFYHVMNRGRSRQKIFHGPEYYETFLATLAEAHTRFGLQIHAYCLMGNHYHLLVSTPQGNLQRAMRHVAGVYTQRHNRLKNSDGTLFRVRYKAILVDSDEYLLHLSKYIHLNPIEAKIVDDLDAYSWSSYPSYVGAEKPPEWLNQELVYQQIGGVKLKTRRYREYVEDLPLSEEVRTFYNKMRQPPVLGSQSFIDSLKDYIDEDSVDIARRDRTFSRPSLDEVISAVASHFDCDITTLKESKKGRCARNLPRKVAMHIAQLALGYKLTEIADYFGLSHYGGVASAVHDVKRQIGVDIKLGKDINAIINRLDP